MLQRIFFGDRPAALEGFGDLTRTELSILAVLLTLVVLIGVWPLHGVGERLPFLCDASGLLGMSAADCSATLSRSCRHRCAACRKMSRSARKGAAAQRQIHGLFRALPVLPQPRGFRIRCWRSHPRNAIVRNGHMSLFGPKEKNRDASPCVVAARTCRWPSVTLR